MDNKVVAFLNSHRVSVLGVLQNDSMVHSATLHFAHAENLPHFYVWTEKASRKCQSLLDGSERNASFVVGFDEEEFATFQAEGKVKIAMGDDLENGWTAYGNKFPDRKAGRENPDMVLLQFTPNWWRFTNMKTDPKTVISSEEK